MDSLEAIEGYLNRVADGLKDDAESKDQKFPVSSIRVEVTPDSGELYAADYAKYLIYGRPPGKQPPVEAMLKFVEANPQILQAAQLTFPYLTEGGLAFMIGRKIGRDGSDIWQGKKEGIDLLGVMDRAKPMFLQELQEGETLEIATTLRQAIR